MTYHPGFQDSKGLSGIFFWGVLVVENSCTKSQDITHYILSISIQILHTVLYTFLTEFTGITFFLKKKSFLSKWSLLSSDKVQKNQMQITLRGLRGKQFFQDLFKPCQYRLQTSSPGNTEEFAKNLCQTKKIIKITAPLL